jgi:hypothetical protein
MTTIFATNKITRPKRLFTRRALFNNFNNLTTNISFERDSYLFQTPDRLPLVPKQEKLVPFTSNANVLETTAISYNKFIEYISRKQYARKLKLDFVNINQRPKFDNLNMTEFYQNKIRDYYNVFIKFLNKNPSFVINSFDDFYKMFTMFVYEGIVASPFTFYSSIYQSKTFYENTGLVIYLQSANLDNDNDIFDTFILNRRESQAYIRTANQFGFEVDRNIPYRLVFNPKRAIDTVNLSNFYAENFEDYYQIESSILIGLFEDLYNMFLKGKQNNFRPVDRCDDFVPTRKTKILEDFNVTLREKLSFYLNSLFLERKVTYVDEREQILDNALVTAEMVDIQAGMRYIMGQVNRLANTRVTIVPNTGF